MNRYSFVIPTYQMKKALNNTLKALDYLEVNDNISYEIIVVDDGSTDGTDEIVNKKKQNYKPQYIYLPRCEKSSRARARNYGIKKASGNIIIFIDSDIIVKPDYLINLNRYYEYYNNIAVIGMRKLINEPIEANLINDKSIFNLDVLNLLKTGKDFRYKIFNNISYNAGCMDAPFMYALSCNLSVPTKWIKSVGGFDEDLIKWGIEDIEFMYRLYQKGLKMVINCKDEVLHQFHGVEEGDEVDKSHLEEVDYNTSIFVKKHPLFMGLSNVKVYELFHSIAINYKTIEKTSRTSSVVINFDDLNNYKEVKRQISELAVCDDTNVIINDSMECTNLDIFVQLLTGAKASFRYYPASKTRVET